MSNPTSTRIITDQWATEHLPPSSIALAAAVPYIEAEVRQRLSKQIEAMEQGNCRHDCEWCEGWAAAYAEILAIVRGQS